MTWLRFWLIFLAIVALYFATGYVGLQMPAVGTNVTLIWLPTGVAVAVFYRLGTHFWPAVSLGSLAVNMAVGTNVWACVGIAVGNTVAPLITAHLLRRLRFNRRFERQRDIGLLAAAAHVGMLVSASNGVGWLAFSGDLTQSTLEAWLCWWAGDAMGVIAAAPLLLVASRYEFAGIRKRLAEFLCWLCVTLLVAGGVFVINANANGPAWALAFIPLPLMAWATLRFGPIGTSLAIILTSITALYGTSIQAGPFYHVDATYQIVLLWLYMATNATLGWLIAALHFAQLSALNIHRVLEDGLREAELGVLLTDANRSITYANEGSVRLVGFSAEELMGKRLDDLFGAKTDAATVAQFSARLAERGCFDGELLNYKKDGTTFWSSLLISRIVDDRSGRAGFLVIQRDITEKKAIESALQQSELRMRTILELEPECVKIISASGCLIDMNPAGLAMIEADSLEHVRGATLESLIEPEHRNIFRRMSERVLAGENGKCEFAIIGLKGTKRWLESHAVPYRDPQGKIFGQLAITRDITEKKLAEDNLRLSEERHRGLVENCSTGFYLYEFDVPIPIALPPAEQIRRLTTNGYIAVANDAQARMYGFERGVEMVGVRAIDLYQSYENAVNDEFLNAFIRNGYHITHGTTEEFDRSGNRVVFSNDCLGIVVEDQLVRIWGAQRDVTQQHRFEYAIRTLMEITAATDLPFEIQLKRILELGCTQFELEYGSVLRADNRSIVTTFSKVSAADSSDRVDNGSAYPVVFEREIRFAGNCCGQLRFFGSAYHSGEFSKLNHDLLTLMARWIGSQMELQSTLSRQRAILENSPDFIRILDSDHRIMFMNRIPPRAPSPPTLGGRLTDWIPPSFRASATAALDEVWRTGRPARFETSYELEPGKIHDFEARITPVLEGSVVNGVILTSTDVTERKQVANSLKESRDRLGSILNSIEEVVYSTVLDGSSILFVSDYCETMYGLPASQFISDPATWFEAIIEEDRKKIPDALDRLSQDRVMEVEYRIARPNGEIRWVHDRSRFIYDEQGQPVRVDGVVTDITERRLAEEKLISSEARYRNLFANNPLPMWVYDLETLRFLAVNSTAVEHYGYSRDEFLAMTIADIRPPADITALMENVAASGSGLDRAGIWRHLTKRGETIQVEITSHTIEFDGRDAKLVLVNDVTERKRLEEQIQVTQQRFQAIVERSHDLILIFDSEGIITFANPASRVVLGYEPEELIGQQSMNFVLPSDRPQKQQESQEIMSRSRTEFRTEVRGLHKDGSVRTLDSVGVNLLDVPALSGLVVNCRDITDRNEREARTVHERALFELLTTGASLPDILRQIVDNLEKQTPGMLCSIFRLDAAGETLRHAAAASLPSDFLAAMDGLRIGPAACSCGTAAYFREPVISSCIEVDSRWEQHRDLAITHGMAACWSVPMISSLEHVLGTLAMYFPEPRIPNLAELANIERAAHFAVLAIERDDMLRSLHESTLRMESLVSNLPGMAYRCHNDSNWTMAIASSGCESITGYTRDELEQNRVMAYTDLIHPDDRDWLWRKCQVALDSRTPCSNTYRIINRTGQVRWVAEKASGIYDGDGTLQYIDGFIQDITEARRIEDQVRASLDEKDAMLKEIHHRVKNNLQIVTSLLSLQLGTVEDEAVRSALRESQNRIRSMALVHETLYLSGNFGRIDLFEYLDALCRHLFRSYGIDPSMVSYRLEVEIKSLDLERAIPLGLIINELVSNSLKYAFPDGRAGRVQIDFHSQPTGYYRLCVSDDGIGMPVLHDFTQLKSLGLQLVHDLIGQLSGSFELSDRQGTEFCISFPIR